MSFWPPAIKTHQTVLPVLEPVICLDVFTFSRLNTSLTHFLPPPFWSKIVVDAWVFSAVTLTYIHINTHITGTLQTWYLISCNVEAMGVVGKLHLQKLRQNNLVMHSFTSSISVLHFLSSMFLCSVLKLTHACSYPDFSLLSSTICLNTNLTYWKAVHTNTTQRL